MLKKIINLLCPKKWCWDSKGWACEYVGILDALGPVFPLLPNGKGFHFQLLEPHLLQQFILFLVSVEDDHKYMNSYHPLITINHGSLEETKQMESKWQLPFRAILLPSYHSIPILNFILFPEFVGASKSWRHPRPVKRLKA